MKQSRTVRTGDGRLKVPPGAFENLAAGAGIGRASKLAWTPGQLRHTAQKSGAPAEQGAGRELGESRGTTSMDRSGGRIEGRAGGPTVG
jgi:hypothetical protein